MPSSTLCVPQLYEDAAIANLRTLTKQLTASRRQDGLTFEALAAEIHVHKDSLAAWESWRRFPDAILFLRWAHECGFRVTVVDARGHTCQPHSGFTPTAGLRENQAQDRLKSTLAMARERRNITQEDLAVLMDISVTSVWNLESTDRGSHFMTMCKYAAAVQCRIALVPDGL